MTQNTFVHKGGCLHGLLLALAGVLPAGEAVEVHTVFQIAGPEAPGLLAEVTELLTHNGLEIRTAAAWTYHGRFALVVGVTERNTPVADTVKLHRLKQLLTRLVQQTGDAAVSVEQVGSRVPATAAASIPCLLSSAYAGCARQCMWWHGI